MGAEFTPARHIHQGEQEIAELAFGVRLIAAGHRFFELIELLVHLLPDPLHRVPLEARCCRFARDHHGAGQGAQAAYFAAQAITEAGVALAAGRALFSLDLIPAAGFPAKDMGMAAHQLGADAVSDLGQIKGLTLGSDLGMQHHLKQ